MSGADRLTQDFAKLFSGRQDVIGLGRGGVERRAVTVDDYAAHLRGEGSGIGIFPLRDDGTVSFAAIDLDEPNFELAREMQRLLPGRTWIERSRSGNAHVWAFFSEPVAAWVPRGIMRAATRAAGREHVEVFPKQDLLREGSVGNYINLPYHGLRRAVISGEDDPMGAIEFVAAAFDLRNDPADWITRARYLQIEPPERRAQSAGREFGTSPTLHECAEYIVQGALSGERPIREGHRSLVYFSLAKQLLNWSEMDEEDAWSLLQEVEAMSPDRMSRRELRRIFDNAATGRWTSTGCDDPLMAPYVTPTCPIAHGA